MSMDGHLQPHVLYDQDGNAVAVVLDGSVYRLQTQGKVLNSTGSQIDPATLGEQQTQTTSLQLIDDVVHVTNGALGKAVALAGQFNDSAPTVATEGNVAPIRVTAQRGLHSNLRTGAGVEAGTASSPLRIDPTGTTQQPAVLFDGSGYALAVQNAVAIPANTPAFIPATDANGTARYLESFYDSANDAYPLFIGGTVSIRPSQAPATSTPVVISAPTSATDPIDSGGNGLKVSGNQSTDTPYVIPNGDTLTLLYAVVGAQGDPNERGSQIELIYDANGTLHLVERYYASVASRPYEIQRSTARDGTTMIGNAGGTNRLIIRRTRLSGGAGGIDVSLRGYLQ